VVDALLARGDDVTVVDNLSTGRRTNLPGHDPRLRFIEADLSEALGAMGPGERFEQIYHFAAAVGVSLILEHPIEAIETNVNETAALLRFACCRSDSGGPVPTLVASSSEVYGKGVRETFSEDDDVVYGPTTRLRWSYANTKAIDEFLALAYHDRFGLPAVICRFFNIVGPRQVGRYGMVLPRFVSAALGGEDLAVFGDGSQSRCFCDVRDVVPVLGRLLETASCHGRVFNVGAQTPISILDLARAVVRVTGSSSDIRCVAYEEAYRAGFEDLARRRPNLERIRSAVGFEPKVSLEQSIRDIAEQIREENRPDGAR